MKHNNLIAIIGMILLVLVSYVVVAPGLDFTIDAISNDSVVNTSLETNVSMTETNETPVIETIPLNESELEEEMPELEVLPVEEQEVNETDPIEELPVVEPETNETITEDPIIEDLGDLNSTNSTPLETADLNESDLPPNPLQGNALLGNNGNISFINSTPANASSQLETNVEINVSINESNLEDLIYNWNGTNYTYYNDSLILMYNFDNVSDLGENRSFAVDLSQGGHNGTIGEAPDADSGAVLNGKYGGAFEFDGDGDEIDLGNVASLQITAPITLSGWFNADTYDTSTRYLISKEGTGFEGYAIGIQGLSSRGFVCLSGSSYILNTGMEPIVGQWYHLALTDDGTNLKCFIDGIQRGITSSDPVLDNDLSAYVGNNFDGTLDELRLHTRALSNDEIYQEYVSNLNKFNSSQWYLYVNQSLNATDGLSPGNYTYQAFATNSLGDENSTGERLLTISPINPKWQNNETNLSSNTILNTHAYFNITLNDSNPDSYIFSFYNGSAWVNDSAQSYVDGEEISVTKNIAGSPINWTWYLNNTDGNTNQTDVWDLFLNSGIGISMVQPNESTNISQNRNYEVIVNVTCTGDLNCGGISVTLDSDNTYISDNFDTGEFGGDYWTTYRSDETNGRNEVNTTAAYSGSYSVITDSTSGNANLNELITNYDFSESEFISIGFYWIEAPNGDTLNTGQDHSGTDNSDAVYFTCDATNWYLLQNAPSSFTSWTRQYINVTADPDFCSEINQSFKIKFTQYGNDVWPDAGIAWDDIRINMTYGNGGIISTNSSDSTFWTNGTNPRSISLNSGESQLVTYYVYATGVINESFTFFAYANRTNLTSDSNITSSYGVTIIEPDNINPRWSSNETNLSDSIELNTDVYFNLTLNDTYPDSYIFSFYNGTTWVNDSGQTYTNGQEIQVVKNVTTSPISWFWYLNDTSGNENQTDTWTVTFSSSISLDLIYPTININVTQNTTFNVTVNASCSGEIDCGEVNVSLDPSTDRTTRTCSEVWGASCEGADPGVGDYSYDSCSVTSYYGSGFEVDEVYVDATSVAIGDTINITCEYDCYSTSSENDLAISYYNGSWHQLWSQDSSCTDGNYSVLVNVSGDLGEQYARCQIGYQLYTPTGTCFTTGYADNDDVNFTVIDASKTGLINTTKGATPFYTNKSSNPYNISLNSGDSEVVTFWVNATGDVDMTHQFFVYANRTSKLTDSNITDIWNVTILSPYAPLWSNNETNLTTSITSGVDTYFNITLSDLSPDSYIFSFYNGTDWENDTAQGYNSGDEIQVTRNINSSPIRWLWYLNDTEGNTNQTDQWEEVLDSSIGLDIIYPNESINVTQNDFFNVTVNVTCVGDMPCREINVTLDPATSTIYNDDFESGEGDWTHGGTGDEWELGTPTYDLLSAHSGSNVWGTDLDSTTGNGNIYWLKTGNISISGATDLNLSFMHWYYFESCCDGSIVEASTDGETWTSITPVGGYTAGGYSGWTGYTGTKKSWDLATFNLSSFEGNSTIEFRFRFGSDGSVTYTGWYIDDINLTGITDAKGGIINTTAGATPFYTNKSTNPYNISLLAGESEVVTFFVNATGDGDDTFEFFVYANQTSKMSISNFTGAWNTTIKDLTNPTINITDPTTENGTYAQNYIEINVTSTDTHISTIVNYLYNSTGDQVNSSSGSTSPYFTNFTNLDDGTYYINSTATDTAGNTNSTSTRIIILDTTPPQTNYLSPTPSNNTRQSEPYFEVNLSIIEATNLEELKYNWNGTNYTYYNDSLVLMYNFDNLSSLGENDSYVVDASQSGNNGTVTGATWNSSGRFGGAFEFDGGSNKFINISDDSTLNFENNSFSIVFWSKMNDNSNGYRVMGQGDRQDSSGISSVTDDSGMFMYFSLRDTSSNAISVTSTINSLVYDSWQHWALVRESGGNISIYLNGQLDNTTDASSVGDLSPSQFPDWYFGNCYYNNNLAIGGSGAYNGSLDEAMMFNRSLSADEISQLYLTNLNKINSTQWYLYVNQSLNATDTLTEGNYTYSVYGLDIYNNSNTTNESLIIIDWTLPVFTNFSNQTYEHANNLTYDINASDLNNISCFSVNDTTRFSVNCTGYLQNNSRLAYGLYWINVTINDTASNNNSNVMWVNVTDTINPTYSELNNQTHEYGDNFSYDLEAIDSNNISCYTVNDTNNFEINCTGYLTNITFLNVSLYWLNITANDTIVGNKNSSIMVVNVSDTTNPTINITYPTNNTYTTNTNITVNYTVSDLNLEACWYSNDTMGVNLTTFNCSNMTNIDWTEAEHNVTVWVNDTYGNMNSSEVLFTIDLTSPVFTNITNQSIFEDDAFIFDINVSDTNPIFNFSVNNSNFTINSTGHLQNNTFFGQSLVGQHWLNITVNDSAGNNQSKIMWVNISEKGRIKLDVIYPTTNVSPTQHGWFNVTVNVSCIDNNCGEVNVSLDPTQYASCNAILDAGESTGDGSYTIYPYDNTTAETVYCDMTTEDGGWTLAFAGKGSTTTYHSDWSVWWTNGTRTVISDKTTEGKTVAYDVLPVTHILMESSFSTDGYVMAYLDINASLLDLVDPDPGNNDGGTSWDNGLRGRWNLSLRNGSHWDQTDVLKIWHGDGSVDSNDRAVFSTEHDANGDFAGNNNVGVIGGESRLARNAADWYYIWIKDNRTSTSAKGGVISTNINTTPFYTNTTNPWNVTLNQNESQVITWFVNASGTANTTYEFFVFANRTNDAAVWNITQSWNVTINDTTNPVLAEINNVTVEYNFELTHFVNSTDFNDIKRYGVNDSSFTINSTGHLTNNTLLSIGLYDVNVTVNDTYDNSDSEIIWVNVTATTLPEFTNLENQTISYGFDLTYDVDATDLSGISCFTVNDTTLFTMNCSGALQNNTVLNESLYWVNITVNDTLGHETSGIVTINVTNQDIVPPRINITSPDNKTLYNYSVSSVSLNLTTSENATCSYSIDSGANNYSMGAGNGVNESNATIVVSPGTNYTANFYCYDLQNNWNRTEFVAFDLNSPVINLTVLYPTTDVNVSIGEVFNVTLNVSCMSLDCGAINVSLDAASSSPFSTNTTNPYNTSLNVGESTTITFWVNSTTGLGTTNEFYTYVNTTNLTINVSAETSAWNVSIVDTTNPSLVFDSSTTANGSHNLMRNITVNVTGDDALLDSVWIYVYNATDLINSTNSSSIGLTNVSYGTYYINASANDTSGNINNTATRTIVLNKPRLFISSIYPSGDLNVSQYEWFNVTINLTCLDQNCGDINLTLDPVGVDCGEITNCDFTSAGDCSGQDGDCTSIPGWTYSEVTDGTYERAMVATTSNPFGDKGNWLQFKSTYGGTSNTLWKAYIYSDTFTAAADYITYSFKGLEYDEWGYGLMLYEVGNESENYQVLEARCPFTGSWANSDSVWGGCNDNNNYIPGTIIDKTVAINASLQDKEISIKVWTGDGGTGDYGEASLDNICLSYVNGDCVSSTKSTISTTAGTIPFYTNKSTNPYVVNLNNSNSTTITFYVNATGRLNTSYDFFAYTNIINDTSLRNDTATWNVTIFDLTSPVLTFNSPTTAAGEQNISQIVINLSSADLYFRNMTLYFYNNSGLINSTFVESSSIIATYTNLSDTSYYINASSSDESGNVGFSETRNITLDNVYPVIALTAPADNFNTSNTNVNFTFTVTDSLTSNCTVFKDQDESIEYTSAGSNLSVSSDVQTTINASGFTDRQYLWYLSCEDQAGNVNITDTRTLIVDTTAPSITVSSPTVNGTFGYNILIKTEILDTLSDVDSAWYYIFNNSNTSQTLVNSTLNSTDTWDANWNSSIYPGIAWNVSLNIYANDSLGNIRNNNISFSVDNSIPVIQFVNPTTTLKYFNDNFSLSVIVQDNSFNYTNYSISKDGTQVQSNFTSFASSTEHIWDDLVNVTESIDGTYNLSVYASDVVSNEITGSTLFVIDNTNPTLTIGYPTPETYLNDSLVTFNWTFVDNISQIIDCNLSVSSTIKTVSCTNSTVCSYNLSGFNEQPYDFNVTCSDNASNLISANSNFTVDTIFPKISFDSSTTAEGNYSTNYVFINVSATEQNIDYLNITLYNSTYDTINTTSTTNNALSMNVTNLANGYYYFNATINDSFGHTNETETRTILLDDTAPVSTISVNDSSLEFGSDSILINWTVTETYIRRVIFNVTTSTDFLINSSTNATGEVNLTSTDLMALDNYTISIYALDTSGNSNYTNTTFEVVDTTYPTAEIIEPTVGIYARSWVYVNATSVDAALNNITIYLYDETDLINESTGAASPYLFNFTGLADGNYSTNMTACDDSRCNSSSTVMVQLDATAPNISYDSSTHSAGTYSSNYIFVNISANDSRLDTLTINLFNSFNVSVNSTTSLVSPFALNFTNLSDDTYYFNATANDTLSNINYTATRTVVIDSTYAINDTDNDGIEDSLDTITYNESNVTKSGLTKLNVTIGGNATNQAHSGVQNIKFYDENDLIFNFTHNLSESNLDLSNISIIKTSTYIIVNLSGQLQNNKSVYIVDNSFLALCVKDAEVASISEMSSGCDGVNETDFTTCLGNSTGVVIEGITCVDEGSTIRIDGLEYSAVKGTVASSSSSPSSESGGGGGSDSYWVEEFECDDGLDNDNDGWFDMVDPGCSSKYDDDESDNPEKVVVEPEEMYDEGLELLEEITYSFDGEEVQETTENEEEKKDLVGFSTKRLTIGRGISRFIIYLSFIFVLVGLLIFLKREEWEIKELLGREDRNYETTVAETAGQETETICQEEKQEIKAESQIEDFPDEESAVVVGVISKKKSKSNVKKKNKNKIKKKSKKKNLKKKTPLKKKSKIKKKSKKKKIIKKKPLKKKKEIIKKNKNKRKKRKDILPVKKKKVRKKVKNSKLTI